MSIAEEQIKQMVEGMTEEEKRLTAKYLNSEFMRDELISRHENRACLNNDLRRANL